MPRSIWGAIAVAMCLAITTPLAHADDPVVIVGLRQLERKNGRPVRRIQEAQRLRGELGATVEASLSRPVLDHTDLRAQLGRAYLTKFLACRGSSSCVGKLVGKLGDRAKLALYGEYFVVRGTYHFTIRALTIRDGKLVGEQPFRLRKTELDDQKLWQRALDAMLATALAAAEPPPPPEPPAPPPPSPANDAPPELPPLETAGPGGAEVKVAEPSAGPTTEPTAAEPEQEPAEAKSDFIDAKELETVTRGITWHGHLQTFAALGIRGARKRDWLISESRLQLDLETDVRSLKIVARPQLVYDGLVDDTDVGFRELYASRFWKTVDLAIGQRVLTWGVTDFWPVVDIINPRDYRTLRKWSPIDEKLPVPVVQSSIVLGKLTLHGIAIVLGQRSRYQLDRAQPFAVPVPAPEGVPVTHDPLPRSLSQSGGGVAADVAIGDWKASLYGLWGRNPLPTVYARVATDGTPALHLENERVAMGAASLQGSIDAIDTLIKTEAAYYHRVDERCEDAIEIAPGTPSCFYFRRVPTARATLGFERGIGEGLDVHLQLIGELTRQRDRPALPEVVRGFAPGLEMQRRVNPIATLRLQGQYLRDDLRPSAFVYWAHGDRDLFANVDIEYVIVDGFAVAAGGAWFEGYARGGRNRYTFAGSLEDSSYTYIRATGWF